MPTVYGVRGHPWLDRLPVKPMASGIEIADNNDFYLSSGIPCDSRPSDLKPGHAAHICPRYSVLFSRLAMLWIQLYLGFSGLLWKWRTCEEGKDFCYSGGCAMLDSGCCGDGGGSCLIGEICCSKCQDHSCCCTEGCCVGPSGAKGFAVMLTWVDCLAAVGT